MLSHPNFCVQILGLRFGWSMVRNSRNSSASGFITPRFTWDNCIIISCVVESHGEENSLATFVDTRSRELPQRFWVAAGA